MNKTNSTVGLATESDLHSVVEPLASYICATDQPRAILRRALAVLLDEVNATSCVANLHVAARSRLSDDGMNLAS
jgi:hypothetical protein